MNTKAFGISGIALALLIGCAGSGDDDSQSANQAVSAAASAPSHAGSPLAACGGLEDHACIDPIVMRILSQSDLKVAGTDYTTDPPTPFLTPAIDVVNDWRAKPNDPRMTITVTEVSGSAWAIAIDLVAGHEESQGGPAGGSGQGDAEADHLVFTIDGDQIVEHQIDDGFAG